MSVNPHKNLKFTKKETQILGMLRSAALMN